uniref:Exocyst subunit Exo70 family protein n=1 Tax=Fagus sylvatica TaxID=28930 RepID=A0A2N9ICX2_FAGSY
MATTTTTNINTGGEDRVLATAQQIVKSLNTPKEVREDMLLIFSSFDNRLSNISNLIDGDDSKSEEDRFSAAEKVILRWDSNSDTSRRSLNWEDSHAEADEYLSAIDEILNLMDELSVRSDTEVVDRAVTAIQLAMSRLEDEFRHVLIRNTVPFDAERLYGSIRRTSLSFPVNDAGIIDDDDDDEDGGGFKSFSEDDRSTRFHERGPSLGDDVSIDLIDPKAVDELREIATRMLRSGYEKECIQVYSSVRREALEDCLVIIGIERLSIEEVQRIEWNSLDEKMKKWIQAMKIVVRLILSGEKSICDQIFCGADDTKEICFNETVKGCTMQLLNFGHAVAIGKKSPEKLFRILDMYDVMAEALARMEALVTDDVVINEARDVLTRLGEAAEGTFAEFEKAVQNETSKKPMQSGEIHPLTRYVMNYVKLIVDYSDTLNLLLEVGEDDDEINALRKEDSDDLKLTPKVKDSDLGGLLGDNWVRKRRGQIRQFATSYLRASWSKVLSCLKDEGIGGSSSNASRVALKERFKNFNACFEEIYRIQSAWKVPDAQLREELRISISEKVIPAYRSFMGRFGNQVESGRHAGKYIKYTADDLEGYLLDLFEGQPRVLHHMRRKST